MLLNHIGAGFYWIDPPRPDPKRQTRILSSSLNRRRASPPFPARHAAFHGVRMEKKGDKRRSICTADELHRVAVSNSDWKLALWRYRPSPEVPLFPSSPLFVFCEYPFGNAMIYCFWVSSNSLVFIEKHREKKAESYIFGTFFSRF